MLIYRSSGDRVWLDRARQLGVAARPSGLTAGSMMKGDVGVALAELDLEFPASAGMPLFAFEGA